MTETSVEIYTSDSSTIPAVVADGLSIDDGWPDFTVGREVELTLLFTKGNHTTNYDTLKEYAEYIYDGVVEYGTDYRQEPYYKEYTPVNAPSEYSLLFRVEPSDEIEYVDGWWVLATNISDETLIRGSGEKMTINGFVLAPSSEGGRSYIQNEYEV